MKQPKESDITALTAKLEQSAPQVSKSDDPEWSNPPAIQIIDCVLSLNRPYDRFVVPRLKEFMNRNPEIHRVTQLSDLMAGYSTPHEFVVNELNYNHEDRARILQSVVTFVRSVVEQSPTTPEEDTLKHWAIRARPQDFQELNIRGFALAGFQYLRMLFGAETTKPDMHIRGFISEVLDRKVSDLTALALLEAASERAGLSVRDVDKYIWRSRARRDESKSSNRSGNGRHYLTKWRTMLRVWRDITQKMELTEKRRNERIASSRI